MQHAAAAASSSCGRPVDDRISRPGHSCAAKVHTVRTISFGGIGNYVESLGQDLEGAGRSPVQSAAPDGIDAVGIDGL